MKKISLLKKIKFIIALFFVITFPISAISAIPDSISYQGKLMGTDSNALTGYFDFEFSIHDNETAESQLSIVTKANVYVKDGLYSIDLSGFSPSISTLKFDVPYWLKVRVKPTGSGSYETLNPRVTLQASPYAFKSNYANDLVNSSWTLLTTHANADAMHTHLFGTLTGSIYTYQIYGGTLPANVIASSIAVNAVTDPSITSVSGTKITGTVALANGGTGSSNDSGARFNLGLEIGVKVQEYDSDLDDLADGSLTGTKVTGIPAANIASGSLGSSVIASSIAVNAVRDGSIVSVSGAKVVGNISGNAAGVTSNINSTQINSGPLPSNVIASSIAVNSVGLAQISAAGTRNSSTFLRGDGTFNAPAGGGDMSKATYDTGDNGIVDDAEALSGNSPTYYRTPTNMLPGNLPSNVVASSIAVNSVRDGSIVSVSGAKVVGNISGNAAGVTSNINSTQINSGSLPSNVIASSIAVNSVGLTQISAAGTRNSSTFLRGDGTFASAAGGGDMSKVTYDTDDNGIVDDAEALSGNSPTYYRTPTNMLPGNLPSTVVASSIAVNSVGLEQIIPSGLVVLLYADEADATGTTVQNNVKSFTVPANNYSRIMVEAEIAIEIGNSTATDVIFTLKFGGSNKETSNLRHYDSGNGDEARLSGSIKYSESFTGGGQVDIDVNISITAQTWYVKSFRVYGVY